MSGKISIQELMHEGGTKSYHLILITKRTGEQLLFKRWGKVGAIGQVQGVPARRPYEAMLSQSRAKQKRGYEVVANVEYTIRPEHDYAEFCYNLSKSALTEDAFIRHHDLTSAIREVFLSEPPAVQPAETFTPSSEIERDELWGSW